MASFLLLYLIEVYVPKYLKIQLAKERYNETIFTNDYISNYYDFYF
nr:MAG TPA: hypothetical protein [Caudoviricetes sp.]